MSAVCRGVDRSDRCFRCENQGYLAKQCAAEKSSCALCTALGKPANYRMGSERCQPPSTNKSARAWDNNRQQDAAERERTGSGTNQNGVEAMVLEETDSTTAT